LSKTFQNENQDDQPLKAEGPTERKKKSLGTRPQLLSSRGTATGGNRILGSPEDILDYKKNVTGGGLSAAQMGKAVAP